MKELRIVREFTQIGNSKGFIIPSDFLEYLNWGGSDVFYIEIIDGKIIIEKIVDYVDDRGNVVVVKDKEKEGKE